MRLGATASVKKGVERATTCLDVCTYEDEYANISPQYPIQYVYIQRSMAAFARGIQSPESAYLLRTAFCPEIFVLIRQRDMPHFAMPAGAFHGGFWLGSGTGRLPLQGLARIKHELYLLLSEHMAYCSVRSSLQVIAKSPDGTMFLDLSNEQLFVPYACSYPYCLRPCTPGGYELINPC